MAALQFHWLPVVMRYNINKGDRQGLIIHKQKITGDRIPTPWGSCFPLSLGRGVSESEITMGI